MALRELCLNVPSALYADTLRHTLNEEGAFHIRREVCGDGLVLDSSLPERYMFTLPSSFLAALSLPAAKAHFTKFPFLRITEVGTDLLRDLFATIAQGKETSVESGLEITLEGVRCQFFPESFFDPDADPSSVLLDLNGEQAAPHMFERLLSDVLSRLSAALELH